MGSHGRFLSQDYIWSGSAYAVFPTLVAVPAAILLLRDRSMAVKVAQDEGYDLDPSKVTITR